MSSPRQGYVLSCNPNSHIDKKFVYKSENEVTVTENSSHGHSFSLACIHISKTSGSQNRSSTTIPFTGEGQRDAFEAALKNDDARTALKIIEELYPNYEGESGGFFGNSVKQFLRDYVACQTLQQQPESGCASFMGKFGIHKARKIYVHHETVEHDDPKLKVPSIMPAEFLAALSGGAAPKNT